MSNWEFRVGPPLEHVSADASHLNEGTYHLFLWADQPINTVRSGLISGPVDKLIAGLGKRLGYFSFIRYDCKAGPVEAYRSITSPIDLYYVIKSDGKLYLSDQLDEIIATARLRRQVAVEAFLELLLFQRVLADSTIAEGVKRLGRGTLLSYDPGNGIRVEAKDRLTIASEHAAEEVLPFIDSRLAELASQAQATSEVVNTLSGGIDSTLLQSYMCQGATSISVAFDSPEYQADVEYAKRAAELTRSQHQFIGVSEERYKDELVRATTRLGQPSYDINGNIVLGKVFGSVHQTVATALFADVLFGLPYTRMLGAAPEDIAAEQVARDVHDVNGYASRSTLIMRPADQSFVARVYGDAAVAARLSNRIRYAAERINVLRHSDHAAVRHCEFGSMMNFLTSPTPGAWVQAAAKTAKKAFIPFVDQKLVELAFSVRGDQRYYHPDLGVKHILKRLLVQRIPEYPIMAQKLGGALPRTRFVQSGPLRNYFRDRPLPDFVPTEFHDALLNPTWDTSVLTLNAILCDIWLQGGREPAAPAVRPRTTAAC